jgi:hypothetical protein
MPLSRINNLLYVHFMERSAGGAKRRIPSLGQPKDRNPKKWDYVANLTPQTKMKPFQNFINRD